VRVPPEGHIPRPRRLPAAPRRVPVAFLPRPAASSPPSCRAPPRPRRLPAASSPRPRRLPAAPPAAPRRARRGTSSRQCWRGRDEAHRSRQPPWVLSVGCPGAGCCARPGWHL